MLIYIEFISRRPGISLEAFHEVAGRGQDGWAADYDEDHFFAGLGRTWRTGPEPEYLGIWAAPHAGLERIDVWEAVFRSGEASHLEEPFRLAARIDRAGCYEPILDPEPVGERERHYMEFLDIEPGASRDAVAEYYQERRGRFPDLRLHLLIDAIGLLAPAPRTLALWSTPTWGRLDAIARDLPGRDAPVTLRDAAFYSTFGRETL